MSLQNQTQTMLNTHSVCNMFSISIECTSCKQQKGQCKAGVQYERNANPDVNVNWMQVMLLIQMQCKSCVQCQFNATHDFNTGWMLNMYSTHNANAISFQVEFKCKSHANVCKCNEMQMPCKRISCSLNSVQLNQAQLNSVHCSSLGIQLKSMHLNWIHATAHQIQMQIHKWLLSVNEHSNSNT